MNDELHRWGREELAGRLTERAEALGPISSNLTLAVHDETSRHRGGRRRSAVLVGAAAVVLLMGALAVWQLWSPSDAPVRTGDGGPTPGATTTTIAVPASCPIPDDPADEQLDPMADLQLARIKGFEPDTRLLHFDPVGWGAPTADADWSVVDDTVEELTAAVAPDAEAWLAATYDGDPDLDRYDPDTAASYLSTLNQADPLAWLTMRDGTITRICEQYHP